jgi:predicted kinase
LKQKRSVEALQWQVAARLLDKGLDVVLENGFWQRDERRGRREEGQQLGARVVLHFLDVPKDILLARIEARNQTLEAGALHITEQELDLWLGSWLEPPDEAELAAYDEHVIHRP